MSQEDLGSKQDLDTILAQQAEQTPAPPPVAEDDCSDSTDEQTSSTDPSLYSSPQNATGSEPPLYQAEGVGLTRTRPPRAPTFSHYMSGGDVAHVPHFQPLDFSQLHFGDTINRKEVLTKFANGNPTGAKNLAAFLDVIAYSEGTIQNPHSDNGYNVKVGGGVFSNDYKDHPRESIRIGRLGVNSTAAGRYQFLTTTWDGLASALNLHDFSPASQDAAALQLVKQAGALQDVLDGRIDVAINKLGGIWASFPGSPYGQGGKSMQQELAAYTASLKAIEQGQLHDQLIETPKAPILPEKPRNPNTQPLWREAATPPITAAIAKTEKPAALSASSTPAMAS